jgi:hypothetical protein
VPKGAIAVNHQCKAFGKAFALSLDSACVVNCDEETSFVSMTYHDFRQQICLFYHVSSSWPASLLPTIHTLAIKLTLFNVHSGSKHSSRSV